MRAPVCPVCEKAIPRSTVDNTAPFTCPHCDEPLKAVRRPGFVGGWVITAFATVIAWTYHFGSVTQLALELGIVLVVVLLSFASNRIFGFELEPVGRIPLGGLHD